MISATVARPTSSSGNLPRPGLQIAARPETSLKLSVLCARTAHSGRRLSSCLARAQPCTFRVDYKLDSVPGREFGSVFLASNENLALSAVAAGWAKARASQASLEQQSPYPTCRAHATHTKLYTPAPVLEELWVWRGADQPP